MRRVRNPSPLPVRLSTWETPSLFTVSPPYVHGHVSLTLLGACYPSSVTRRRPQASRANEKIRQAFHYTSTGVGSGVMTGRGERDSRSFALNLEKKTPARALIAKKALDRGCLPRCPICSSQAMSCRVHAVRPSRGVPRFQNDEKRKEGIHSLHSRE